MVFMHILRGGSPRIKLSLGNHIQTWDDSTGDLGYAVLLFEGDKRY
jgi:hypothetical protein